MRGFKVLLGSLTAVAVLGMGPARSAEPLKIRMSWVVPISNWGSLLLEKKDLARHLGQSYTLESTRYNGTPPMITALANGELDIATLTFSSLGLAIQNAGMSDLRVIADEFQDGVGDYYSDEFFVLKDGTVQKTQDLKGKIVATNAGGSAVDIASRAMLRKAGLEDKRDYTVVEAPFPAMRAMLAEKKVDLTPGVLPFSLDPELKKISRPLFLQKDAVGTTEMSIFVARQGFLEKNRAAVLDFLEDTLRIVHWYEDPANHKEVVEIAARITKQPAERFGWVFTKQDYFRDPNMVPNLDALQANINTQKDLGFLKDGIDIKKQSDVSYIQEAAKRLK